MNVKIENIQTFPLIYPTIGRFKFFEGPKGRPTGRPAVLVKITADNGVVGWGQSVPVPKWSYETLETVNTTINRYLAPELIGLNPADTDAIQAAMKSTIAPSFSTGQPICKAGIDLALADLNGKFLQQNAAHSWKQMPDRGLQAASTPQGKSSKKFQVAEAFESRSGLKAAIHNPKKITLSWTLNPRTLDEIEGLIQQAVARGYKHFNVKIAPDPKFDLEMCRIVKRLVPEGFLWADANGGYNEATALEIAPKLADIGVPVFEQPIPANRLTGYQRLKKQGALPIIMDEGIVSSVELEEFIKLGLLDGVAIKPARCGGLTEARRQIEIIKNAGLMFLGSGLTDPDFGLAASLILYGACDLQFPAALNAPQFIDATILKTPFQVENGDLLVPTGPGLGVEIDEKKIEPLLVKI